MFQKLQRYLVFNRFSSNFSDSKGFSIIGILVASAVGMIVSLGLAKVMTNINTEVADLKKEANQIGLVSQVSGLLKDCQPILSKSIDPNNLQRGEEIVFSDLKDGNGRTILYVGEDPSKSSEKKRAKKMYGLDGHTAFKLSCQEDTDCDCSSSQPCSKNWVLSLFTMSYKNNLPMYKEVLSEGLRITYNTSDVEDFTCNFGTKIPTCPSGERWDGNACVSLCLAGERWDGSACVSLCLAGQIWNGSACICSGGRTWNGSACVCSGGRTWNGSACICSGGRTWNGSACICSGGRTWNGSACICSGGRTWNGSACVCSGGRTWNGSACICSGGRTWNGSRCYRPAPSPSPVPVPVPVPVPPPVFTPTPSCPALGSYWDGNSCRCPPFSSLYYDRGTPKCGNPCGGGFFWNGVGCERDEAD